jgi:DNA polymerase
MSLDIHRINAAAGFQTPTDPQYPTVPWFNELLACQACPARQEARRVVPGAGPLTAEIAVVGQNPGEEEDQTGVPFIGRGGDELNAWLRLLGLRRDAVLVTNICKCHTTNNRPPLPKEIQTCETLWWARELAAFARLKVIIPLGRPALLGLVGKVTPLPDVLEPWWMKAGFGERELIIIPLAHPAYLLRTPVARPTLYDRVLPVVRDYIRKEAADVYQRAAL